MMLVYFILSVIAAFVICFAKGMHGFSFFFLFVVLTIAILAAILIAYVLVLYLISLTVNFRTPQTKNEKFFRFLLVESAGLVLSFLRVQVRLEGAEKVPVNTRFLLVSNHRSGFDPVCTLWALRKYDLAFISKKSNFKIPIGGALMHKCCCLGLDREDDREALRAILSAAELIKKDEVSYCIYPEGTRNKTGRGLLPFRNGAFKIAQRAKVPIVVAGITGADTIMKNFPLRPTSVTLNICGVIDTADVSASRTNELGEEIRNMLEPNVP